MIHYQKFHPDIFDLEPAKETYMKRPAGKGWPEECPPLRAANAFGFDVLANFTVTFTKKRGGWRVEPDVVLESDFTFGDPDDPDDETQPFTQQYAWFWQKGQKIPHEISDNVYPHISNQVKISSFLYMKTDPNELLLMIEPPNHFKPWRTWSAVVDTDWYPASYPWHCVLELDPAQKSITIEKGTPLVRLVPVRRDTYFASPMQMEAFVEYFERSQQWLATHGRPVDDEGGMDITKRYGKQQMRSRFVRM